MSELSTTTPTTALRSMTSTVPRPLAVAGVALLAVFAWSYWPNFAALATIWSNQSDYSHGFLILPIAGYLLYKLWPRDGTAIRPSYWGPAVLAPTFALRAWAFPRGDYWIETATILPAAAGMVLTIGGPRLLRKVWPAVAFLIFMLTIPKQFDTTISLPLQKLAAKASTFLLRLLGVWIINEGNVLLIGTERLDVARACSGLAMLMSLAATVTAASLLLPMERWKRFVLLTSIVPIALLCNVIRIMGTAWAYRSFGTEVGKQGHDVAGWLMMPLAIVLVGLELAWMNWLVAERPDGGGGDGGSSDGRRLLARGGAKLAAKPVVIPTREPRR